MLEGAILWLKVECFVPLLTIIALCPLSVHPPASAGRLHKLGGEGAKWRMEDLGLQDALRNTITICRRYVLALRLGRLEPGIQDCSTAKCQVR